MRRSQPVQDERPPASAAFSRALLAFMLLPGVVAIVAPPLIAHFDPWRFASWIAGVPVMVLGACALLWCVRDFYVSGKGTLAPWSPPKQLVVVGLYRYCRNPMYVGVLTLVAGWALVLGSPLVASYGVVLALAFHLRVVTSEEPSLEARFPRAWAAYKTAVPRWWPRKTPCRSTLDAYFPEHDHKENGI